MNKFVKKSLYLCAATLMLGSVVAPVASPLNVSARSRHVVRKYSRKRNPKRSKRTSRTSRRVSFKWIAKAKKRLSNDKKALARDIRLIHSHKHNHRLVKRLNQRKSRLMKMIKNDQRAVYRLAKDTNTKVKRGRKMNKKRSYRRNKKSRRRQSRSTRRHAALMTNAKQSPSASANVSSHVNPSASASHTQNMAAQPNNVDHHSYAPRSINYSGMDSSTRHFMSLSAAMFAHMRNQSMNNNSQAPSANN